MPEQKETFTPPPHSPRLTRRGRERMKLAIIDLDGVVADSTIRFEKAHDLAVEKLRRTSQFVLPSDPQKLKALKEYKSLFYTKEAFYNPSLVAQDTLLAGAVTSIWDICDGHDYLLIYLSSRPEFLRNVTYKWLFDQNVLDAQTRLILKPTAFQYTKTTTWKAGTVQTLTGLYDASRVLFIDDEQVNRDALMDAWMAAMAAGNTCDLHMAASLQEALETLKEGNE